jgi:hypothetical protein
VTTGHLQRHRLHPEPASRALAASPSPANRFHRLPGVDTPWACRTASRLPHQPDSPPRSRLRSPGPAASPGTPVLRPRIQPRLPTVRRPRSGESVRLNCRVHVEYEGHRSRLVHPSRYSGLRHHERHRHTYALTMANDLTTTISRSPISVTLTAAARVSPVSRTQRRAGRLRGDR